VFGWRMMSDEQSESTTPFCFVFHFTWLKSWESEERQRDGGKIILQMRNADGRAIPTTFAHERVIVLVKNLRKCFSSITKSQEEQRFLLNSTRLSLATYLSTFKRQITSSKSNTIVVDQMQMRV